MHSPISIEVRRLSPNRRLPVALLVAIRRLSFSLSIDKPFDLLEITLHTSRSPLLTWQSSLQINAGQPFYDDWQERTIRRFAIASLHSDHYVLLARRLAQRFPWLAEYREATTGYMPTIRGVLPTTIPAHGRIRPFAWDYLSS